MAEQGTGEQTSVPQSTYRRPLGRSLELAHYQRESAGGRPTTEGDSAMGDAEIKNVRKNRDGDITDVGVRGRWEFTVAQTVASIEAGTNTFYVNCPQRANVYVAKTSSGHKFLKTSADTTTKNNLDNLPPL